jgi:poly-gamma-glutamate capsule biosynthesis protein CapA/YwtB (metallophosphatase superfamily)
MNIIIGGDVVPTKSNIDLFGQEDFVSNLDLKFCDEWFSCDYRIFNLECPIGSKNLYKKINKNGPYLIADEKAINGIVALKPSVVCLANNHILDYGLDCLNNTEQMLNAQKIKTTGIEINSMVKFKGITLSDDNIKVGIYNVCENEFSVATFKNKGANGLIESKCYKEILQLKNECDFLIVIFHAGKEYYRYPSPNLQLICRAFIDFGADFVVTQHSHCIGCEETYMQKKIVYGQGNFIFDDGEDEFLNTGLLIKLTIFNNLNYKITYIPIEKNANIFKMSDNKKILLDFNERSNQIKNIDFIYKKYGEFSDKHINEYLNLINRIRPLSKIANRLFNRNFFNFIYNKQDCIRIENLLRCEAHNELFLLGLERKVKKCGKKNINIKKH